ncbi:uncharacterized protein LOC133176301 [Saccostrea echinata]|uniref:uncharacterized protein LOC133176301 n=1 Tax=Saccostrea echinata TaxID=191078 RepID=UPI002A837696|nr:uncharacterized protein LOC133176301 [Saccostrea echinata]
MEPRRSGRIRRRPAWHSDYVMDFPVRKSIRQQRVGAGDALQQPEEMALPPLQPVLDLPEEELEQTEEMALPSTQSVIANPLEDLEQPEEIAVPALKPVFDLPEMKLEQTEGMAVLSTQSVIAPSQRDHAFAHAWEMALPSSQSLGGHPSWLPSRCLPSLEVIPQDKPPPVGK